MSVRDRLTDSVTVEERRELRQHIARILERRAPTITHDLVALIPYAGLDPADDAWARLADLAMQILVVGAREGEVDGRSTDVADLRRLSREKRLAARQLFELVYLVERTALDELALDESFGATSEPWPSIEHIVRRASFDMLGAFAERRGPNAGAEALSDPLTTLHTRAVLVAALEKEIRRSERSGHPFALIAFALDHLAAINARHGYGFGDRVLERTGILIRNYFREHDWVSRASGDTFAVLLPETQGAHAEQLAERVRETVQGRMSLRDYLSEEQVLVTVSAGVVIAEAVDGSVHAGDLIKDAEQAILRATLAGGNRVERVDINVKAISPPRATQGLSDLV